MFFFFNDTATTEIYTLSLHDALPISSNVRCDELPRARYRTQTAGATEGRLLAIPQDRKSTRLNSSHQIISYAVFCLKKKISNLSHLLRCTGYRSSSPHATPHAVSTKA